MQTRCFFQSLLVVAAAGYGEIVLGEDTLAEELWVLDSSQSGCGGSYFQITQATREPTKDTRVVADKARLSLDGTGRVQGNVVIEQQGQTLEAQSIILDTEKGTLETPQGAEIVSNDIAVRVGKSNIGVNSESVDIQNAEFVMLAEGYRGHADTFRSVNERVELTGAFITQCPPKNTSWSLTASELRIDRRDNIAVAKGVGLRLGNAPLVYLPYIRFPIERKRTSGFLLPQVESSSLLGFELGLPLYFNLAPNYDFTLTPKLSTKHNHSLEFELRHINEQSDSKMVGILLPSDSHYQEYVQRLLREPLTFSSDENERWLLDLNHDLLWDTWTANVAYSMVSDTDFYRDFGESVDDFSHVGLARMLRISRVGTKFNVGFLMERYDPFRQWGSHVAKLPQITLGGNQSIGPMKMSLKIDWALLESSGIERLEEFERRHGELAVSLPLRETWGYGTLKAIRTLTQYQSPEYDLEDRATTTYLLDTGLWLERNRRDVPIVSHLFEPRLVYARRADVPQIGFPDWDSGPPSSTIRTLVEPFRRAGIDSIGELQALSLSAVLRFVDHSSGNVKTKVTWVVSMPKEGYGIDVESKFSSELSASGFHLIRPDRWTQKATGALLRYRGENVTLVGQIRQHQPDDLVQSFVSTEFSLNERWKIHGRWNYDWTYLRQVETFLGFEYSGCCIGFKFLWRKSLRYGFADWEDLRSRTGLHFELSLKGLTSFGDNIASIVERRVPK